jgi:hypothetical protein
MRFGASNKDSASLLAHSPKGRPCNGDMVTSEKLLTQLIEAGSGADVSDACFG